jgi:hypothetical protein
VWQRLKNGVLLKLYVEGLRLLLEPIHPSKKRALRLGASLLLFDPGCWFRIQSPSRSLFGEIWRALFNAHGWN